MISIEGGGACNNVGRQQIGCTARRSLAARTSPHGEIYGTRLSVLLVFGDGQNPSAVHRIRDMIVGANTQICCQQKQISPPVACC